MRKRNFFQRFGSPTPIEWGGRAKSFGLMAGTFGAAFGAVKILNISTPQYFDMFVGGVVFVCTGIATYSQQKDTPAK